ncbi:MAG: heparin lyase I family protein [Polyangiaceae bacterium]
MAVVGTRMGQRVLASAVVVALAGCDPTLNVGKWICEGVELPDAGTTRESPLSLPWSTGFEKAFCDYQRPLGICYHDPVASYETVTSPVHSGSYAAAFNVVADDPAGNQTRCFRQGTLPTAAYYGAWYFVPALATNTKLWNLIHFRGGSSGGEPDHPLWDVSLSNTPSGDLKLIVFDQKGGKVYEAPDTVPIPIGKWFRIRFYLKRAADATGEVALYQDNQQLFDVTNIVTDATAWGQWYVGNLANGLTPADSTLYVDDVTISTSP